MATTKTKPNIYQRLNACMRDVEYVQKNPAKKGMQYSYASHDAVTRKCRAAFVEHGVFVETTVKASEQDGNRTFVSLGVCFVNIDNPEERVCVDSIGYGIDNQDKGPGKAISYAYKYALLKCLALETGDDPEADSIEHRGNGREKQPTREDLWLSLKKKFDKAPSQAIGNALNRYKAGSDMGLDMVAMALDDPDFAKLVSLETDRMAAAEEQAEIPV